MNASTPKYQGLTPWQPRQGSLSGGSDPGGGVPTSAWHSPRWWSACRRYETQKRTDVETRERTRETKEAAICWLNLATTVRRTRSHSSQRAALERESATRQTAVSLLLTTPGAAGGGAQAAQEAGNIIREAFYQPKKVTHKGSVDLVTETDKACEALLKRIIRKGVLTLWRDSQPEACASGGPADSHARATPCGGTEYPNHKFIGEEESSAAGVTPELTDVPTWIIDPVDGTTNFVHGFPFVCVCIGVTLRKQVIAGVVHNPILNETFTASLDGGAFLNGASARLRPSAHSSLERVVGAQGAALALCRRVPTPIPTHVVSAAAYAHRRPHQLLLGGVHWAMFARHRGTPARCSPRVSAVMDEARMHGRRGL